MNNSIMQYCIIHGKQMYISVMDNQAYCPICEFIELANEIGMQYIE